MYFAYLLKRTYTQLRQKCMQASRQISKHTDGHTHARAHTHIHNEALDVGRNSYLHSVSTVAARLLSGGSAPSRLLVGSRAPRPACKAASDN